MIRKLEILVVLVLGVMILGSCKTMSIPARHTHGGQLAQQQSPSTAVTKQGAEQDEGLLPFKKLVAHYAEWRKQGVSVREALCRLPHIGRVYTIDDYHTAVRVKRNPASLQVGGRTEKELIALGVAYGGKPYTLVMDQLTGKMVPFRRVEIRDDNDLKHIYWVNLSTGKRSREFLYNAETGALPKLRLEGGEMNIVQTVTYPSADGTWRFLDVLVLKHPDRQPFMYKTPYLLPISEVPNRALGGKLDDLPVFKSKSGFGDFLKGFFNSNKTLVDEDKLEYVLAICHKAGGKARWVVSRPPESKVQMEKNATVMNYFGIEQVDGVLTEVSPVDGWAYATTDRRSAGVRPEWYLGCEAVQPFVLKGKFWQSRDGRSWRYDETLYPGRQITEIKFKPLKPPAKELLGREVKSYVAKTQLGGRTDSIPMAIALETARTGFPLTKFIGATKYESSYNGEDSQGCTIVAVTRISDTTPKRAIPALETTFNYRICGTKVEDLGITMPQTVREDVLDQLPGFSMRCQRYGETKMKTVNYELYCRPLRGESQCDVEIVILKQGRMVKKFLYDGCKGSRIE